MKGVSMSDIDKTVYCAEICVSCGDYIPDGMVCQRCGKGERAIDFLSRYRKKDQEINSLCEVLNHIRELTTRTSSDYTRPAVQTSHGKEAKFESLIDRLIDMQNDINKKIDELVNLKPKAEQIISSIDDSRIRAVMRYRYICGWSWEKIARKMHYSVDHVSGYLHKQAVVKLTNING